MHGATIKITETLFVHIADIKYTCRNTCTHTHFNTYIFISFQ